MTGDEALRTSLRGRALLAEPTLNKGTAFSHPERQALGLEGLLPAAVESVETQLERVEVEYGLKTTDLGRHVFLRELQDENEVLFYRFLCAHLEELLPIVYTPTVGDACRQFSRIYRRPRGVFVSYPDRDRIDDLLATVPDDVAVIVVTDGERILGLGDQGVGGMGIPIGKLALYTAFGGIDPARTLPVLLDTGTDNEDLLADPLYMGWRHERVRGDDYEAFVNGFVDGVVRRFPGVLLQWEDFAGHHAGALLERYRHRVLSFNDDIQGTAAVALATILAGLRSQGRALRDQRVCIVGAGAAGTGIGEQLVRALVGDGIREEEARRRVHLVDRHGLLHDRMPDLSPAQAPFAQPWEAVAPWAGDGREIGLLDTVKGAQPSVLVGVSGQPGLFTEPVVRALHEGSRHPIAMPLSNPTERSEAAPTDLLAWTDGDALVATGSPFDDVTVDGSVHEIAQANNVYVFPGLGLGAVASSAERITDQMLTAAAWAVSDAAPCVDHPGAPLLPAIGEIRSVSRDVARAVCRQAQRDGVAPERDEANIEASIEASIDELRWNPEYRPVRPR